MITYKTVEKKVKVQDSITCDVCTKSFDMSIDIMEIQEFTQIDFIGGYDSVFGDGASVKCDICQECLKNILGKFLRIIEDTNNY